jgi:hypothetical protein
MKKWLVPVALVLVLLTAPTRSQAETIFGVTTDNTLISFDSANPGVLLSAVPISNLVLGESIVGMDFRPAAPGQLVGVGLVSSPIGGLGFIRTIDTATGMASLPFNTIAPSPPTFPGLAGSAFGVDFNPVPDALRIVSNASQNLRIVMGGAGMVNVDTPLNPTPNSVVGAAYSNNVPGGIGGQTTLYVIDSGSDRLLTQGSVNFPPGTSPNTGMLFDVGPLGINTNDLVGFDISGFSGTAFASLTPVGATGSSLYSINLATGQATLIGAIGGGNVMVRDISVSNAVPEPGSLALTALGAAGLIFFAWRRRR